jgi:hypothetical protein
VSSTTNSKQSKRLNRSRMDSRVRGQREERRGEVREES